MGCGLGGTGGGTNEGTGWATKAGGVGAAGTKIFAQEGRGLYDVRHAAIGHLQQGGDPSAFDRIMATKLVAHALGLLADQLEAGTHHSSYVGLTGGRITHHRLEHMNDELDLDSRRPLHQW